MRKENQTDARLREALKRCSPGTYDAASRFRATGDMARLPVILLGVVEHYVPADRRAKLNPPDDALRLNEDLAIDSLTLLEIGFLAEEVFEIMITDDEMQHLRTLGDIRRLMERKVGAISTPRILATG